MEPGPDLLTAASERFATRDYRGAALLLDSAIREGRGYADAHHLLGMCYALTDQPEQALKSFDSAVRLNPRYVEAHLNRAIVLGDLGRASEAQEGMKHALTLGAPDASGRFCIKSPGKSIKRWRSPSRWIVWAATTVRR